MDLSGLRSGAVDTAEMSRPVVPAAIETIFVIDSSDSTRSIVESCFRGSERPCVEQMSSCAEFLLTPRDKRSGCVLIDSALGTSELLDQVCAALPVIMMTRTPTVAMAVRAMQAGAVDFIVKPLCRERVLASISRLRHASRANRFDPISTDSQVDGFAGLTARQQQILNLVIAGLSNKLIAANLSISQRTVENHRAAIMRRMACRSVASLVTTVCEIKHRSRASAA